ncbi:MAG: glycosyltransferase, partial [Nanoarchaeota archaeon]
MSVDVVIPNYNGFELVKENLPKVIEEAKRYGGSIIIVDDGSNKDEFESLSNFVKDKNILLLRNERNSGFSSAVNRGMSKSNSDFVVLLNTDVLPEDNFLDAAIKDLLSDGNLFGLGFMDKSVEDGKTILRGRGLAKWEKGFLVHRRGEV